MDSVHSNGVMGAAQPYSSNLKPSGESRGEEPFNLEEVGLLGGQDHARVFSNSFNYREVEYMPYECSVMFVICEVITKK